MTRAAAYLPLVVSLGCSPHGSLGHDLPDETGTDDGDVTSAGASSTASDGHDTDAGSSTHAHGSDGSSGPASTDESSTTAADACAPAGDDTPCIECRKLACCDFWIACIADEVCTCIDTCIADGGDPVACETTHCGGPSDTWIHVQDCSATNCAAEC